MCVIIITNPKNPISKKELRNAWNVNPDGAGYAYINNGEITFERGFMNFKHYYNVINELQQHHNLLLHLRISTAAGITPQGTHPYKAGNVLQMKGVTNNPVMAMNGIIRGQCLDKKKGIVLNDTASYIYEHPGAFKEINQDILDIISSDTAASWVAATTNGIIHSNDFITYNGRKYSNLNHIDYYSDFYDYSTPEYSIFNIELKHIINKDLYNQIYNNWQLFDALEDYTYYNCNIPNCKTCKYCMADCKTETELKQFLKDHEGSDQF